jgi:hypothetical protein
MNEELKKAVIKSLEKNFKNGPLTAKNLAGIYSSIIENNSNLTADQIAAMINEADLKSEQEDLSRDD